MRPNWQKTVLFCVTCALTASACRSLDSLDGVKLGEPSAVVYNSDADGSMMVVFSNVGNLCDQLGNVEGPDAPDWWVVSAVVNQDIVLGEEMSATGFASITQDGETTEYTSTSGSVEVNTMAEQLDDWSWSGRIEGKVDLSFDTGDDLRAKFEAEYCDFNLFQGQ